MEDLGICCQAEGGQCQYWLVKAVLFRLILDSPEAADRIVTERRQSLLLQRATTTQHARKMKKCKMNKRYSLQDTSDCFHFIVHLLVKSPTGGIMKPCQIILLQQTGDMEARPPSLQKSLRVAKAWLIPAEVLRAAR